MRHYSGALPHNFDSHHREIRFCVDPRYTPEKTALTIECSVPKLWYGHNIHLLYDWQTALEEVRKRFNKAFRLNGKYHLESIHKWVLTRVDVCYAYRFPNQRTAQAFIDSLKVLKYPYKTPVIYPTSIFFKGTTYSLKFYLKYPEFRKHDMRALIKNGASLDWVQSLEDRASGVFRVEATLRTKYLRRQNITTVSDLATVRQQAILSGITSDDEVEKIAAIAALSLSACKTDPEKELFDGMELHPPSGVTGYRVQLDDRVIELGSVSATIRRTETPTALMQLLLSKFVGDGLKMRTADKVEQTLREHYKPVKASRLTAFWLYFRQFGAEKTLASFGRNSYYPAMADLKKAGITMIETPDSNDDVEKGFLDNFTLVIPSNYVTNKFDDFQDSDNVLNLPIAK